MRVAQVASSCSFQDKVRFEIVEEQSPLAIPWRLVADLAESLYVTDWSL